MASDKPFHVCQLGTELVCSHNSDCPGSQVCGVDNQCRDQCESDRDCVSGQVCAEATCAEPKELNAAGRLPVASAGAGGDESASGLPCSYNSDCVAPLLCRSGMCGVECKADVDCSEGHSCLDSRCVVNGSAADNGGEAGVSGLSAGGGSGASGGSSGGASGNDGGKAGSGGCVPTSCSAESKNCGVISDGCGQTLDCGACSTGKTCGGGGIANVCGVGTCSASSCAAQGKDCGLVSDGCSWLLNCGSCEAPEACGGAGKDNVCGCIADPVTACAGKSCGTVLDACNVPVSCGTCAAPATCGGAGKPNKCGCTKTTCAAQGKDCGSISDACGGTLDCGGCASGVCGGGSAPNVCGAASCSPSTCVTLNANCGTVSDGCSLLLPCGDCTGDDSCGGAGKANVCGCTATSCAAQNKNCGTIADGCGGSLDCGDCPYGSCGALGNPNVCGCAATSCAAQHKNCGTISDACGGLLPCGSCQSPEVCGGDGIANVCAAQQTPPSCQGGGQGAGHTCGTTNDDCCSSLAVTGGSYNRDNDASFPGLVSDFRLDRYLVSVGRFRAFIAAGRGIQTSPPSDWSGGTPAITNSGWNPSWKTTLATSTPTLEASLRDGAQCNYGTSYGTWTNDPSQADNNPINCLTWYEAMAFCSWDGGWLPTEEQLDYAQVGGSEQRVFPWSVPPASSNIDYSFANFLNLSGAPNYPIAVGSKSPKGDGRWGQTDLVGNEGEWTMDVWNSPYALTSCSDCAYLGSASTLRVVRSAGWNESWETAPYRRAAGEGGRDSFVGFRCARLP